MTSLLAIPEPQSVDLERAHNLAQRITEWAGQTESIPELEDARARVAAIETYIRKRDAQAAAALAAADRRLEVRIGELLGPAKPGPPQSSDAIEDCISKDHRHQFRQMAQHQEVPEVAEAIANGSSRSEVMRRIDKARGKHPPAGDPKKKGRARVEKARAMAAEGYTSRQIAEVIGVDMDNMADFRRRHGIEVPADEVVGKTSRINPDRVVGEAASTLEGVAMGLGLITPDQIDPEALPDLCASMQTSLRQILKFHQRMKELRDG